MDDPVTKPLCTAKIVANIKDGVMEKTVDLACGGGEYCLFNRITLLSGTEEKNVNAVGKTEIRRQGVPGEFIDGTFVGPCTERR